MSSTHALPKIVSFPVRQPIKAKRRQRRRLPWVLCCLCAIVAYFMVVYVGQELELIGLRRAEAGLRDQVTALEQEALRLQRELALLNTDAYIERAARERLGLLLPQDKILWPVFVTPRGPSD
ncbi:MAG: Cell division protein FtsL [Firmicutes bacterium]|nr:Cell division protein FtsL [candidate division NPL-UPA2 bacterium]MBT9153837.1 Cell division protein FtsL [candidate division NPL-UPA2 bacterium]MBT9156983.1 Cell division protein FtsL [candidate division NPL-UPA2 bacterium]